MIHRSRNSSPKISYIAKIIINSKSLFVDDSCLIAQKIRNSSRTQLRLVQSNNKDIFSRNLGRNEIYCKIYTQINEINIKIH